MSSTTHPPSPPLLLDDDIHRTVESILTSYVIMAKDGEAKCKPKATRRQPRTPSQSKRCHGHGRDAREEEAYGDLLQSVTQAVQEERNGWKEKLHAALQELDRHHKEKLTVQSHLQNLLDTLHNYHLHSNALRGQTAKVKGGVKDKARVKDADAEESSAGCVEMVQRLYSCVRDLQDAAKGIQWDQDLQWSVECLQRSLARCEEEKEEQAAAVQQKVAEIQWLRQELDTLQHSLHRLQDVILNYNTAHSSPFRLHHIHHPPSPKHVHGLNHPYPGLGQRELTFHSSPECLDKLKSERTLPSHPHPPRRESQPAKTVAVCDSVKVKSDQNDDPQNFRCADSKYLRRSGHQNISRGLLLRVDDDLIQKPVKFRTDDNAVSLKHSEGNPNEKNVVVHERTYVEGDRTEDYVTPAEELTVWKQRVKHKVMDVRGRGSRVSAGVTQCLRCQQLFMAKENNPRACHYHHKGREIRELYDRRGRLTTVLYKWACCHKGLDIHGCAYGYHI